MIDLPLPLAPRRMLVLPCGAVEADVFQHDVVVKGEGDMLEDDGRRKVRPIVTGFAARCPVQVERPWHVSCVPRVMIGCHAANQRRPWCRASHCMSSPWGYPPPRAITSATWSTVPTTESLQPSPW